MRKRGSSCGFIVVLVACVAAAAGENLDLPVEKIPGEKPGTMMSRYWLGQAEKAARRWQADYEARKTPDQIAAYQKRLRVEFLEAIGGLPERTPLNPRITGTVHRDGYRVEKVIFESQPAVFACPQGTSTPGYGGLKRAASGRNSRAVTKCAGWLSKITFSTR